jgi:hypothetical protein
MKEVCAATQFKSANPRERFPSSKPSFKETKWEEKMNAI